MDSIRGYRSQPDTALFRKVVREAGCAIIGQTADLAPADRRFYAVRDVTATVESVPLITASILSKKLAAGLGSLVLDVKAGNGAFMGSTEGAAELAESLVAVANGAGLATTALLTDMNEPLASCAGNAVEVANAVRFLTGEARDARLEQVVLALAAEMLLSAGRAENPDEAGRQAREALESGRAAEIFARMVALLGGPKDFLENWRTYLPKAPVVVPVPAERDGFVSAIATRDIGLAVVELGGGRRRAEDKVDHAVGITEITPLGSEMKSGDPLALVYARTQDEADRTVAALGKSFTITEERPAATDAILRRIAADG
jgi:thymidine phosphorylase